MLQIVRGRAYDPRMRKAYVVLAGIMLLNVVYQFVSAGAVVFEGEETSVHESGAGPAHLWPLAMIIVAAVGKLGRTLIILAVAVFVLVFLQYPVAENAGIIHPLVGLLIAFATYHAFVLGRAGLSARDPAV